jgi:hypothetical protein
MKNSPGRGCVSSMRLIRVQPTEDIVALSLEVEGMKMFKRHIFLVSGPKDTFPIKA